MYIYGGIPGMLQQVGTPKTISSKMVGDGVIAASLTILGTHHMAVPRWSYHSWAP